MSQLQTITNSLSKFSLNEEVSLAAAYESEAGSRKIVDDPEWRNRAISNERIRMGEEILGTYIVRSDAILGGMGSVWRVHHKNWDIDLAMKRPQPRFFAEGSEKRKRAFIEECQNWISLVLHPCVVSCYYVREIGGVPTIFSEWMKNGSLRDRIRDDSLYIGTETELQARILDIAIQAAKGLEYSHQNGLLHQDMKPGNILIGEKWAAKVSDFGLAAMGRDPANPSAVSGYTPEYCPREQMEGAAAGAWMDVYAWALTVLEMYCGGRFWETGAQAKELLSDPASFPDCRVPVPDAMKDLLIQCVQNSEKGAFSDFTSIIPALEKIYREITGKEYKRLTYAVKGETADSLNNYALSFLDLKQEEVAEKLWEEALRIDPNHRDAFFNRALYELRSGKKHGYEILEEMKNRQQATEQDFEEIERETGELGAMEVKSQQSFRISNACVHAALSGDELVIADYNSGAAPEQGPFLHRVKIETGELLETDPMEEVRAIGAGGAAGAIGAGGAAGAGGTADASGAAGAASVTSAAGAAISRILLAPGGRRAVIFLENKTIALYDTLSRKILRLTENRTFDNINEYTASFSRDGELLALYKSKSYTFVLFVSSLYVECMGISNYVCRHPEKGLLFRGYGYNAEAGHDYDLFCQEANGTRRMVYRFAKWPKTMVEYDCEPFPFLYYSYEDAGASQDAVDGFYLNERFGAVAVPYSFVKKLPPAVYFDPVKQLYISQSSTSDQFVSYMMLWNLARQRRLCTVVSDSEVLEEEWLRISRGSADGGGSDREAAFRESDREVAGGASYRGSDGDSYREALLCKTDKAKYGFLRWRTIVIPEKPLEVGEQLPGARQPAKWRVSRIKSSEQAAKEEGKIDPSVKRFVAACENGDSLVAREIYRNCLNLWGFEGSELCYLMEDVVDSMYKRLWVNAIRPAGETSELPQCCLDSRHESVWYRGNRYVLYSFDNPAEGARVVGPDGNLINEIRFPASTQKVWFRGIGKFFAFSDSLECRVFDLEGRETEVIPAAVAGASGDMPEVGAEAGVSGDMLDAGAVAGAPVLMDLDLYAGKLLYKDKSNRLVERNIRTGEERRLRQCLPWVEGRYLNDGSVVLPLLMNDEFGEEDFEYVEEFFPDVVTEDGEVLEIENPPVVFAIGRLNTRTGKLKGCFPVDPYMEKFYESCRIRTSSEKSLFFAELEYFDMMGRESDGENLDTVVFDVERVVGDPYESVNDWARGAGWEETILLPGGEFLCGRKENEIWIRILKSGMLAPVFLHKIKASNLRFRPDGREFYAEVEENGRTVWKVFRLQYAYWTESGRM